MEEQILLFCLDINLMQWNQTGSGMHTSSNLDQCQGKEGNDLQESYRGTKVQKRVGGADTKIKTNQPKTQKEHSSKWKKERLNPFPACEPMSFQQVFLLVERIKPILLARCSYGSMLHSSEY